MFLIFQKHSTKEIDRFEFQSNAEIFADSLRAKSPDKHFDVYELKQVYTTQTLDEAIAGAAR